jgi:hypothetical protein
MTAQTETTYELIQHTPSGETYLARFDGETITGLQGPLHHSKFRDCDGMLAPMAPTLVPYLESLFNGEGAQDAEWANAQTWAHLQRISW